MSKNANDKNISYERCILSCVKSHVCEPLFVGSRYSLIYQNVYLLNDGALQSESLFCWLEIGFVKQVHRTTLLTFFWKEMKMVDGMCLHKELPPAQIFFLLPVLHWTALKAFASLLDSVQPMP